MLRLFIIAPCVSLCLCVPANAQFGSNPVNKLKDELKEREQEVRDAVERRDREKQREQERKEQARKKREADEKAAAEAAQREAEENRRKAEAAEVSQLRELLNTQIANLRKLELDIAKAQLDAAAESAQAAADKRKSQNEFDVQKATAAARETELELEKIKIQNQAAQWWWGAVGAVLLAIGGIVAFVWRVIVDKATMRKLCAEIDTLKKPQLTPGLASG